MEENEYDNISLSDKIKSLEEQLEKRTRLGILTPEKKSEIEHKISCLRLKKKYSDKISDFKPIIIDEDSFSYRSPGYLVDMTGYEDSNSSGDLTKSNEEEKRKIKVHCPKCGYGFTHEVNISGQVTGGIGGAAAGAILGGKIGLALGPFGAIAGTIPGAILGGVFGKDFGNDFDNPRCPNCATKFQIPNSLK